MATQFGVSGTSMPLPGGGTGFGPGAFGAGGGGAANPSGSTAMLDALSGSLGNRSAGGKKPFFLEGPPGQDPNKRGGGLRGRRGGGGSESALLAQRMQRLEAVITALVMGAQGQRAGGR